MNLAQIAIVIHEIKCSESYYRFTARKVNSTAYPHPNLVLRHRINFDLIIIRSTHNQVI